MPVNASTLELDVSKLHTTALASVQGATLAHNLQNTTRRVEAFSARAPTWCVTPGNCS